MLIAKDVQSETMKRNIKILLFTTFTFNIDSGVKVKRCHDVDCNFAKEGICNNEDEHQKQWNEAEKATEEVLIITNNMLFIFVSPMLIVEHYFFVLNQS